MCVGGRGEEQEMEHLDVLFEGCPEAKGLVFNILMKQKLSQSCLWPTSVTSAFRMLRQED